MPKRRCRECGYDLAGHETLATCPECGAEETPINDSEVNIVQAARQLWLPPALMSIGFLVGILTFPVGLIIGPVIAIVALTLAVHLAMVLAAQIATKARWTRNQERTLRGGLITLELLVTISAWPVTGLTLEALDLVQ